MKKTLLLKFCDNLDERINRHKDIDILDCTPVVYMNTVLGYELVDGLTNEEGMPFYRLMAPSSIMEELSSCPDVYDKVSRAWNKMVGDLLFGYAQDVYSMPLPKEFVYWLLNNENVNYVMIGEKYSPHEAVLTFEGQTLHEDVVLPIVKRIAHHWSELSEKPEYLAFTATEMHRPSRFWQEIAKLDIYLKTNISILLYNDVLAEIESEKRWKEEQRKTEVARKESQTVYHRSYESDTSWYERGLELFVGSWAEYP